MTLQISEIPAALTYDLLLNVHYAKRIPSISFAFGLFEDGEMVGITTYGTPAGSTQRTGFMGKEMADRVLELNRLCLVNNRPNEASKLVSGSLRLLPRPKLVISYADIAQRHVGTVYKAANAVYLGLTAKRTDWALHSRPSVHGQTLSDEFRGQENRAKLMREKYGDDFYLKPRSRKHRYVWLLGSKGERARMRKLLRYEEQPYPSKAIWT